ncbi:hypothetical protein KY308_01250 [Candidatus Woesearchaeota archaeon]|nr:hypothetical protein [Candidatus Woesearchaeota archaeon]
MKKKGKNQSKEKHLSKLSYIPIFLAAAIMAIGFVSFVMDPVFFGLFTGKVESFEDAVQMVQKIDSEHNISFSDYDNGFYYIYHNPRADPLNVGEIDDILKQYSRIHGDEAVQLFIDFRMNLLEAEKYFKISKKSSKGDIFEYGLRCRNEPYIFESIENQNISAQRISASTTSLLALKSKYPDEFSLLGISDDWIDLYLAMPEDFQAEIEYTLENFNKFCLNSTSES